MQTLLRIFLNLQLYGSSKNCLKLLRTLYHFRELYKKSENCLRFPRTLLGFWELFEISENYLKISKTVWEFQELFETSENYARFWEHLTRNHGSEQCPFRAIVHISSNFVSKLSNDTALTTPGGRLFQSFITRMLKKCLCTLFLTKVFFILNLCPLVIEVLLTWNNAFSDSSSPCRIL